MYEDGLLDDIDLRKMEPASYSITIRPNDSINGKGRAIVVGILAFMSFAVAIAFGLIGAWMVLPFAGLELVGVAYAFYYIHCHANDFERITIEGDAFKVVKSSYKQQKEFSFNRYWVKVITKILPCGDELLFLSVHGKELEFGARFMNSEQRILLAKQLKLYVSGGF